MDKHELYDDMIDLGDAKVETRGIALLGDDDVETGAKYAFGGIQTDD